MTALLLTIPSVIASPQLGKYRNGLPDTLDGALYAGYLHGTDFHTGSPVSDGNPLFDLSGNGRHLTQTGSTVLNTTGMQTKGFLANGTVYMNTPFTADQLSQAGTDNEFTLMSFGLYDPTGANGQHNLITSLATAPARQVSLRSDGGYDANLIYYDDVALKQLSLGNPANTLRITNNICVAATINLARLGAFTAGNGIAIAENSIATTSTGTRQAGGAEAFTIGKKNTSTANTKMFATLFFNRVLTSAELATVYNSMKALLAAYSVSV